MVFFPTAPLETLINDSAFVTDAPAIQPPSLWPHTVSYFTLL